MSIKRGRPGEKSAQIYENVEVEVNVYVSEFDTEELIAELEYRGYHVSEGPVDPPSTAASIRSMAELRMLMSRANGSPSCPTKT